MIRIFQGNTLGPIPITVRGAVSKEAVDLTGVVLLWSVKSSDDSAPDDSGAILSGSVTIHSDQTTHKGMTTIPLIEEDLTTDIPVGNYKMDLKFVKDGYYVLNTFAIPFSVLKPQTIRKA